jgi:hypothetical protein
VRPVIRRFLPVLLLASLLAAAPARAAITILPDSTVSEVWQLSNGLKVVIHHISTTHHVAMTLAWPTGSDADPPGLEGHAALLAELEFFSAAGDVPERTRAEMGTVRPSGWGLGASPRVTQISEIATLPQFPGVLHQLAIRLRGVTVTDSSLRRALASTSADVDARRRPTSTGELYGAARSLARGSWDPDGAVNGAKALTKLKPAVLQDEMRKTFTPARGVLSLAGNLGGINIHALIENEFGSIPAGSPTPEPPVVKLSAMTHHYPRKGLSKPVGVVGIVAPALEDTLHPSFYFATLMFATSLAREWGPTSAPLGSRFQFSLFDDPEMVRLYPPPDSAGTAANPGFQDQVDAAARDLAAMIIPPDADASIVRAVSWLMGGTMPPEVLGRAARDPSVLGTVAQNQAVRELWGGEPFWSEYRRRFLAYSHAYDYWLDWLLNRNHRVELVLDPAK